MLENEIEYIKTIYVKIFSRDNVVKVFEEKNKTQQKRNRRRN